MRPIATLFWDGLLVYIITYFVRLYIRGSEDDRLFVPLVLVYMVAWYFEFQDLFARRQSFAGILLDIGIWLCGGLFGALALSKLKWRYKICYYFRLYINRFLHQVVRPKGLLCIFGFATTYEALDFAAGDSLGSAIYHLAMWVICAFCVFSALSMITLIAHDDWKDESERISISRRQLRKLMRQMQRRPRR